MSSDLDIISNEEMEEFRLMCLEFRGGESGMKIELPCGNDVPKDTESCDECVFNIETDVYRSASGVGTPGGIIGTTHRCENGFWKEEL